jgi:hypothetical protein
METDSPQYCEPCVFFGAENKTKTTRCRRDCPQGRLPAAPWLCAPVPVRAFDLLSRGSWLNMCIFCRKSRAPWPSCSLLSRFQCAVILPCCGIRSRARARLTMRTSDANRLRNFRILFSPVATLRIVKPDLVRKVRRRAFPCAAFVHPLCSIHRRYTDSSWGARSRWQSSCAAPDSVALSSRVPQLTTSPLHTRTLRGPGKTLRIGP